MSTTVTNPEDRTARLKAGFLSALRVWCDLDRACEAANLAPELPDSWRRDDADVARGWESYDARQDRLVIETLRHRGLEGDGASLRAYHRTLQAPARPVDPSRNRVVVDPPPPEVAAAMLEAGLAALGEPHVTVPAPALKTSEPVTDSSAPEVGKSPPPALLPNRSRRAANAG